MSKNKPTDAIALGNLSKRFDDEAGIYDALKGIDLTVHKGEFVAIMGPSGSGKSTLMNIISNQDLAKLRRDKIGFVFQNFNLLPRLNIRQNVEMPLIYKRVAAKEREDKVIKALSSVGLLDKINTRPNRMSGGQIQRAAIARALINDPSIILADEPTGNLDTKTGKEIMNIIKSLNNKGATIILVTHNPEVSNFADRTIVVRDGLIKAGGAVE